MRSASGSWLGLPSSRLEIRSTKRPRSAASSTKQRPTGRWASSTTRKRPARPCSTAACAEAAFSPLVVLLPYRDLDDVLARVNDSPGGLQAGLFSRDVRVIYEAFERLEVGALIVNDVNSFRVDQMPYGGAKQSGLGREGMRYAIREMTTERLLVLDPR